jgi:alpha-amylase
VGEYWAYEEEALKNFIAGTEARIMLFDVHLLENFARAGNEHDKYDLTTYLQ